MALIAKPFHKAKKNLKYKLQFKNEEDTVLSSRIVGDDKAETKIDHKYLDLLLVMSYIGKESNIDIRGLVRLLLIALSERYSNEEIKELIIRSEQDVFREDKKGNIVISNKEDNANYSSLLHSISKNASVISSLVGETGIFSSEEEINNRFTSHLENIEPVKEYFENSNEQTVESSEADVKTDTEESNDNKTNSSNSKKNIHKNAIEELMNMAENSGMSNTAFSFVEGVIKAVSSTEASDDEVEQYICSMLHGLGLIIPKITEYEINEMLSHISAYIRTRGEAIINEQNAIFEQE